MSSAPEGDEPFTVTVKRVPGGVVSNWMIDHVAPGDTVEVTPPAGVFCSTGSAVTSSPFAAGSGITPIISLLKFGPGDHRSRGARLLYANRDPASTIFREDLDRLEADAAGRLRVLHRWDVDHGFLDAAAVGAARRGQRQCPRGEQPRRGRAEVYVCGPGPFMDVVESAVLTSGIDPTRLHIERFSPAGDTAVDDVTADGPAADDVTANDAAGDDPGAPGEPRTVTIELDGRTDTTEHRAGHHDPADGAPDRAVARRSRASRAAAPPAWRGSSRATVAMHVNNALTDDEVDEGWVLTCQSVPTSSTVHVVYGFD